ncbi:MAG: hypothetical protein U1C73_11210 [Dietzia sp.]|nr:hypothetical protein [Dietzia sp.]
MQAGHHPIELPRSARHLANCGASFVGEPLTEYRESLEVEADHNGSY